MRPGSFARESSKVASWNPTRFTRRPRSATAWTTSSADTSPRGGPLAAACQRKSARLAPREP
eukprot:10984725-Alexandrium_andersonii.AAC.1